MMCISSSCRRLIVPLLAHYKEYGWVKPSVLPVEDETSSNEDVDGVHALAVKGGDMADRFGRFVQENLCMESWDFILDAVKYEMVSASSRSTEYVARVALSERGHKREKSCDPTGAPLCEKAYVAWRIEPCGCQGVMPHARFSRPSFCSTMLLQANLLNEFAGTRANSCSGLRSLLSRHFGRNAHPAGTIADGVKTGSRGNCTTEEPEIGQFVTESSSEGENIAPILFDLFGLVPRHTTVPSRLSLCDGVIGTTASVSLVCLQESSCEPDDQFEEFLILLNQYLLPTSPDEVNISSKMSKRMASFKTRYDSRLDRLFNIDFSVVDSILSPENTWPIAPLSRSDT